MNVRHLLLAAALLGGCATGEPTRPRHHDPGKRSSEETPGTTALTDQSAAYLRTLVEDFVTSQAYPNLVIGVVMGGELVWEAGFGAGATPGTTPNVDTCFRAGSITKLVTATALLELAEEGVLSLDDEASKWLPEVESVLSPEGVPAITLRHLLSHGSGLPRNGNGSLDWTRPGTRIAESDVLAALDGVTLSFSPGTSHLYSNLGVALAGIIGARASGQEFRSFVQQRVLDPLQMRAAAWDAPAAGLAPGHHPSPRGGYERAATTWRMGAMEPAGGLFTTVRDLAQFAAHGLGHGSLLDRGTLTASQTALLELPGATGIGLGWFVTEVPKLGKIAWHNGSTSDYGAFLAVSPEHDVGVAILMGSGMLSDVEELRSLAFATIASLVDPHTEMRPQASSTPAPAVSDVGERLLALFNDPTAARATEAFVPAFFATVPQAQLLTFFEQFAPAVGVCVKYTMREDRGGGSFVLRVACARGDSTADVTAETAPPHRISRIVISPLN